MRYLLRISLLIIIMTLTTATASADKYSRAWKKVENYIKQDLPESAAKEINHIWDMATKDGDGRQMLKSAVYLTQVQQTYGENSIIEGIELFRTLLPTLKVQEHKALCHAFIAKGYLKYWELNKAKVSTPELHRDDYELCWVLRGKLKFSLPKETHVLSAGMSLQFDALMHHSYEAMEDVEMLLIHLRKGKRF